MTASVRAGVAVCVGLALLGSAAPASADGPANKIFGYAGDERILEYDVDENGTVTYRRDCVPNPGLAGLGIALDARQGPDQPMPRGANKQTRVLYNTGVTPITTQGDGLIHRNTLPVDGCRQLAPIPFGEGPGGPNQDDIGALDFHDTDDGGKGKGKDTDILYAAGFHAVTPTGSGVGPAQMLFKLDGETGEILGRCEAQAESFANDTLTFARLKLGGRTEEVLLTDLGRTRNNANGFDYELYAIDEDSLLPVFAPAPAPVCEILAEFPEPLVNGGFGVITGADYEKIRRADGTVADVLVANGANIGFTPESANFYDVGGPPFSVGVLMGSTAPSDFVNDNTVARITPPDRP